MKRLIWTTVALGALALGCDSPAEKPGASSASSASEKPKAKAPPPPKGGTAETRDVDPDDVKAGEEACVAYHKALEDCIAKGGGDSYKETLKKEKEALAAAGEAEKAQIAEGCAMGVATLKQDPTCQ